METVTANIDADEFLTPADAGRLAGLTSSGINAAAAAGRLPIAIRTRDGRRLYARSAVLQFKAAREARGR